MYIFYIELTFTVTIINKYVKPPKMSLEIMPHILDI